MRAPAVTVLGLLLAGCVAQDAGYGDVRNTVADRTRLRTTWSQAGDGSVAARRTRELLAKPLTAEAAVQVALFNSPDLQAEFEELGLARADLVHALRLPNPTLDAALHFHGDEQPDLELELMLDLTDLVFLPSRASAARAGLDAAKIGVAGAVLDHALQTRIAYYRYQAADQIVELLRTVLLATKASADAAERIHEAGNVTDLELATQRALYEDARLDVAQAEASRIAAREKLAGLMGVWGPDASFRLAGRLGDPAVTEVDPAEVERLALQKSLDLERARKSYTAAAKQANLARVEGLVPELKAGVSAERDEGEWGVGPAVGIEIPIFYQGQGEVARARAQMRRHASTHRGLGVRIRSAARSTSSRLVAARDRALHLKGVVLPLRQRIVDETQLQYNAMNTGVFQLLSAKRDQIQAARQYIEALRDYWIARAELDQLLAGRLSAGAGEASEMPSPAMRSGDADAH